MTPLALITQAGQDDLIQVTLSVASLLVSDRLVWVFQKVLITPNTSKLEADEL